jgi:hypothetical protein
MNLGLEEIYYIGQTIMAGFFVGSLVFVGLQLRRNTQAVRFAAAQALTERFSDMFNAVAGDSGLAKRLLTGGTDPARLAEVERFQFYCHVQAGLRDAEAIYVHAKSGVLERGLALGVANFLSDSFARPGVRQVWSERKLWFSDSFREYIDTHIVTRGAESNVALFGMSSNADA